MNETAHAKSEKTQELLDKPVMDITIGLRLGMEAQSYESKDFDAIVIYERSGTMGDKTTQLPWEALEHTEGVIPWPELSEFAAAVVRDRSLTDELVELYEQAYESECDHERYEEYYVPAIFALAAPQLSDERRREIGAYLIEKLAESGYDDAEISMEVLAAACGSMGPVILPAVLDAIENEPDMKGAWLHLWGLTELAAQTKDAEIRDPVIQACTGLLEQVDCGEIEPLDGISAAWTLAHMKCSDSVELLQRVKVSTAKSFGNADYANALDLLQGCLSHTPRARSWERPVREWLEPNWNTAKQWYSDWDSEDGDDDETDAGIERFQELATRFMQSHQAEELADEVFEDAAFIVFRVLEYARDYVGSSPEELDEHALREALLELFPRKITAERDFFENVAPVTEAFLRWMDSEDILTDTADLVETVHNWADTIVANGMDPKCWGMGKSFAMQAKAEGIDMEDREAAQQFMAEYNRRLFKKNLLAHVESKDFAPPIPIAEHSPKIGRNEPCPCGSGKKYKKCCGSVKNIDVHN